MPVGLESHWDGKKLFRLGKTLPEAYRTWADRIDHAESDIETIESLCDRYAQEHIPTFAPKTQESYLPSNARIRAVFGKMPVGALTDEVQDWEIDALLSFETTTRSARMGQLYTRLKIMLGCRRGNLLRIKLPDLKDDGIHVTPSKTKESAKVRKLRNRLRFAF